MYSGNQMKEDFHALKLKQWQYESGAWKRTLGFMMDENAHMKNRLSEVLSFRFNHDLLEEIEDFHNRSVKTDQLIGLLRNNIAEMDKLLAREIFEDGKMILEIQTNLQKLRNNMLTAENQFGKLNTEFNSYLSEKIK
jgi:hypothetical protein